MNYQTSVQSNTKDDGRDGSFSLYYKSVSEKLNAMVADGEGLVSPELGDLLAQEIGAPKGTSSFQIRMPFVKGVVHKVRFRELIRELLGLGEGEKVYLYDSFRKDDESGKKDDAPNPAGLPKVNEYGERLHDLDDIHLILTKSMFKAWKLYLKLAETQTPNQNEEKNKQDAKRDGEQDRQKTGTEAESVMDVYFRYFYDDGSVRPESAPPLPHCLLVSNAAPKPQTATVTNYQFLSTLKAEGEEWAELLRPSLDKYSILLQSADCRILELQRREEEKNGANEEAPGEEPGETFENGGGTEGDGSVPEADDPDSGENTNSAYSGTDVILPEANENRTASEFLLKNPALVGSHLFSRTGKLRGKLKNEYAVGRLTEPGFMAYLSGDLLYVLYRLVRERAITEKETAPKDVACIGTSRVYSPDIPFGKDLVISRNPHLDYSENTVVKAIEGNFNPLYGKYFGELHGVVMLPPGEIFERLSGADNDGDIVKLFYDEQYFNACKAERRAPLLIKAPKAAGKSAERYTDEIIRLIRAGNASHVGQWSNMAYLTTLFIEPGRMQEFCRSLAEKLNGILSCFRHLEEKSPLDDDDLEFLEKNKIKETLVTNPSAFLRAVKPILTQSEIHVLTELCLGKLAIADPDVVEDPALTSALLAYAVQKNCDMASDPELTSLVKTYYGDADRVNTVNAKLEKLFPAHEKNAKVGRTASDCEVFGAVLRKLSETAEWSTESVAEAVETVAREELVLISIAVGLDIDSVKTGRKPKEPWMIAGRNSLRQDYLIDLFLKIKNYIVRHQDDGKSGKKFDPVDYGKIDAPVFAEKLTYIFSPSGEQQISAARDKGWEDRARERVLARRDPALSITRPAVFLDDLVKRETYNAPDSIRLRMSAWMAEAFYSQYAHGGFSGNEMRKAQKEIGNAERVIRSILLDTVGETESKKLERGLFLLGDRLGSIAADRMIREKGLTEICALFDNERAADDLEIRISPIEKVIFDFVRWDHLESADLRLLWLEHRIRGLKLTDAEKEVFCSFEASVEGHSSLIRFAVKGKPGTETEVKDILAGLGKAKEGRSVLGKNPNLTEIY